MLVSGTNRYSNGHAIHVVGSSDVTIVNAEAYSFHAYGIVVEGSVRSRVVKSYANSRDWADLDGGAVTNYHDQGDIGIVFVSSVASGCDNCASEDSHACLQLSGGSKNGLFGSIALGCANGIVSLNETKSLVSHSVAVNCSNQAVQVTGTPGDTTLSNLTVLTSIDGIAFGVFTDGGLVLDSLVTGGTQGFSLAGGSTAVACDSVGNTTNYLPIEAYDDDAGFYRVSTSLVPTLVGTSPGRCIVYVPSGSNLKGLGFDGGDVGANIVDAYADGGLTSTKLWDGHGNFPCGPVVAGVNDVPDASCGDLGPRLHVGVGGCPVP
jgi:hypothetical protein